MSGRNNDRLPAFPSHPEHGPSTYGMSLRDYFAGQALAGYFAAPHTPHQSANDCAAYMYATADAMIAEREKGGDQ